MIASDIRTLYDLRAGRGYDGGYNRNGRYGPYGYGR